MIMKNFEDYKMTPRQEKFVRLANDNGFVNKISRKDIVILQAKYGVKWPAWLIKNTVFRYGRGVYKLPSLLSAEEHILNVVKLFGEEWNERDNEY
jgi:hypothetical protein|tara:strand:+ start:122 stop:406 length:285 start_codon:yes stop_codon:yes gene_type:complete